MESLRGSSDSKRSWPENRLTIVSREGARRRFVERARRHASSRRASVAAAFAVNPRASDS